MNNVYRFPDEILVEPIEPCYQTQDEQRWLITSSAHKDHLEELTGQTNCTDSNLESLRKLGYAVCNNTLDCRGRKVYIHHNARTFRENRQKKS